MSENNIETEVGESLVIDIAQSNGVEVGDLATSFVRWLRFAFSRSERRLIEGVVGAARLLGGK